MAQQRLSGPRWPHSSWTTNDAACCLIGPGAGGFISTPCSIFSSPLLVPASLHNGESIPKEQEYKLKASWNWGLLIAHCHFWYIQLAEASYRASPDSWGGKASSTVWWKKQPSHTAMGSRYRDVRNYRGPVCKLCLLSHPLLLLLLPPLPLPLPLSLFL